MGNSVTTRGRILSEGAALASRSGLEGVTLGTLADHVGMSKSGLFAHFRSKEAVQISLLEHTAALADATVVAPAMGVQEGLPRLTAVVANWFGWAPRAGLPGGCAVAAGLFEYDDVTGPVRDTIAKMESDWRGFLNTLVGQAVDRGHFRRDLDTEQFVWELSGIYLAHHVSARFLKSRDADERAEAAFSALVARAGGPLPKKPGARRRVPSGRRRS